ncbi:MAG: thiamine pyrophosphate-binding protein [Betaproteobacteria bacterium]|nr:thiamine pyrophosphate-binding protein [Betaproteobacteria bacterium]
MRASERPLNLEQSPPAWASDVAAAMLRATGFKYVALNPGASYRGFHDSLVNFLGNRDPQMLLCLHEDHAVSIAHGYAKASDEPMACVLHSNVGLMHGLMGIFNAWCDRMPILVIGATGPVESEKRRPWIDWIHTAKDQGALLRDFTKWDDEPRSAEAIVEGILRGAQVTRTEPRAPVYVCLDAGLQEQSLAKQVPMPDPARYGPAPAPCAAEDTAEKVASLLASARQPLILMGRVSRSPRDWERRVHFAELLGAPVLTSVRERSAFPTDHPLHVVPPFYWVSPAIKDLVQNADVILSLDWVDLNGTLQQVMRSTSEIASKIVHVSLDSILHKGWSMDHFGLPPVDVPVLAGADSFVHQVIPILERTLHGKSRWNAKEGAPSASPAYGENAASRIEPRDLTVALAKARGTQKFTIANVPRNWATGAYHFRDPLDFLGHNGGGGLGAGPGVTVGAALALKDSGRAVVSVIGDGDFLQGATALWTASHYRLPALFIVSNNRSNFNDEIHQQTIAKTRGRPVENRWIGQRIDDPAVDFTELARAQGVEGEGPVKTVPELERAIERGLAAIRSGKPYLIDAFVPPVESSPQLPRGG